MSGYASREYAESWREFGTPERLSLSGGFLLRRTIPASDEEDVMGCYPLFECERWCRLDDDLRNLPDRLVSLTAVVMAWGQEDTDRLSHCFPDLLRPFKDHYLIEFRSGPYHGASRHHRYYARRALRALEITIESQPQFFLEDWLQLYSNLIERHELSGMHAFSRRAFQCQLAVPGIVLVRATEGQTTVAMHLWFQSGPVAYSHLQAASERGYELGAAYGLYWHAIEYFADKVHWLDLGGTAGTQDATGSGLAFFKQGWANTTRPALLCGRILNRSRYEHLAASRGSSHSSYFPAYRSNEMGG